MCPSYFIDFAEAGIQGDDNISLERIPEEKQLARNTQTSFRDSSNSIVAGSATHSLVLKNKTLIRFKKNSLYKINSHTA